MIDTDTTRPAAPQRYQKYHLCETCVHAPQARAKPATTGFGVVFVTCQHWMRQVTLLGANNEGKLHRWCQKHTRFHLVSEFEARSWPRSASAGDSCASLLRLTRSVAQGLNKTCIIALADLKRLRLLKKTTAKAAQDTAAGAAEAAPSSTTSGEPTAPYEPPARPSRPSAPDAAEALLMIATAAAAMHNDDADATPPPTSALLGTRSCPAGSTTAASAAAAAAGAPYLPRVPSKAPAPASLATVLSALQEAAVLCARDLPPLSAGAMPPADLLPAQYAHTRIWAPPLLDHAPGAWPGSLPPAPRGTALQEGGREAGGAEGASALWALPRPQAMGAASGEARGEEGASQWLSLRLPGLAASLDADRRR